MNARFEYKVMFLVNDVRIAVFLASAAALSCLILDHLLCPDCRAGLAMKVRRHCAHIEEELVDLGREDRESGPMTMLRVREAMVAVCERIISLENEQITVRNIATRENNEAR